MPTSHQLFRNNADSTVNGTIAIGASFFNVAPGHGLRFPTPSAGQYFLATLFEKNVGGDEINFEIVKVTSVTGDTLTVVRDFEGIVVGNGGTSGGWAYPSSVGINPSQIVYVQLRLTAYGAGNALAKDGNLEGLESAAAARANLGISAANTPNTPAGNIAATTVQAALYELDAEKVQITSATGSAKIPAGTTAQRDGSPGVGWTRFNSTLGKNETWNGTAWASSIDSASPVFTGVLTTAQRINIPAAFGALQVNGSDVLRFGSDSSGQLAGFRNAVINGNFQVNQRAYVSGAAVGTNLYGHDRWKMAASTDTYTYSTVNNKTTVTIPAGKVLQQVIEGVNLQSGTYTLSWEGTAQGKIGAGAYGASGITGTAVGGTNLTIEFGPGTVSRVQFEAGSIATPFENRPYGLEESLCQRYYYRTQPSVVSTQMNAWGANYTTTQARFATTFPVPMRVAPTALEQSGTAGNYAVSQAGTGVIACSAVPLFGATSAEITTTTFTVASGLTAGIPSGAYTGASTGANAYLGWSAEL